MDEETFQPSAPWTLLRFWETYKIPLLLGLGSLLLIAISLTLLIKSTQTTTPIEFSSAGEQASVSGGLGKMLTVDVEGAVVKPGVYNLPDGSRVEEALAAAGGLSPEADQEKIAQITNRAAKLLDGAKLYFPKKEDPSTGSGPGAGVVSGVSSDSRVSSDTSVSVNFATQAKLEALPGIGPVIAGKIISNRPYQVLEELLTKKVLGRSLFDKLKNQLTL